MKALFEFIEHYDVSQPYSNGNAAENLKRAEQAYEEYLLDFFAGLAFDAKGFSSYHDKDAETAYLRAAALIKARKK